VEDAIYLWDGEGVSRADDRAAPEVVCPEDRPDGEGVLVCYFAECVVLLNNILDDAIAGACTAKCLCGICSDDCPTSC